MKPLFLAFLALLAAAGGNAASAEAARKGELLVSQAWARATPDGARIGAVWLVIENRGAAADRLVAARSDAAERIELHRMQVENGLMTMGAMEGIEIPRGGRVALAPGGWHLMLLGLKHPLREGESFAIELIFARAGAIPVPVSIAAPGAIHHPIP